MEKLKLQQELRLGPVMFFSHIRHKPVQFNGGNGEYLEQIDIPTPFYILDHKLSVVNVGLGQIMDPKGESGRFGVDFIKSEVVGDSDSKKTLRVYYKVFCHGPVGVEVTSVSFNGVIVSGNSEIHSYSLDVNESAL